MNPELSPGTSPENESSVGNPETTGEKLTDPDAPFVLNDDEKAAVARVLALIDNDGIQAALILSVADEFSEDSGVPAQAARIAIKNLSDTCSTRRDGQKCYVPANAYKSAPSLLLIVSALSDCTDHLKLPKGYLPSDALVEKCLAAFYADKLREAAAKIVDPEPDDD